MALPAVPRMGDLQPVIGILLLLIAKSGFDNARADYQAHRYQSAETKFAEFIRRHPQDPEIPHALYYRALLQSRTDSSRWFYCRIISSYPATEWAERSLFDISKIDYALNNYLDAVSSFQKFTVTYPQNQYRPEALYWLGFSYTALHDSVSADKVLTELARTYPFDPWSRRAGVKVVSKPVVFETHDVAPIVIPVQPPKPFTIQVGSFQSQPNAQSLVYTLHRLGYTGEIHPTVVQGKNFFRVWVGSFASGDDARPTLEALKTNGITGQLVTR